MFPKVLAILIFDVPCKFIEPILELLTIKIPDVFPNIVSVVLPNCNLFKK